MPTSEFQIGSVALEVHLRNVARIKLGYYPLPLEEGKRLWKLLDFSTAPASVVDPCVGTGEALHQLTEGAETEKHGVELDANRAAAAAARGIRTIHGDLFNTIANVESFSFLFLNPPYDSEIGSMDNKRMEFLFLQHTYRWLVEGGVLLMVVPQARLDSSIPLLAENFADIRVFRLTDPESQRFDQVALFGVRKRMRGQEYSRNRAALHEMVWRHDMPMLQGNEMSYRVPVSGTTQLVYRGLPLDQIEDLVVHSSAWKQVEALLLPKEENGGWPANYSIARRSCGPSVHGRPAQRRLWIWRGTAHRTLALGEIGDRLRSEREGLYRSP
jgi:tRNA1(Val) A37 N6-methylase TrmN6